MINYFANNLRYLRTQRRLTQTELADKVGKQKTTISNYEQGYRHPSNDDLRRIANYFHISTERLLNEDLTVVNNLDVENWADYIKSELIKMQITEEEFNQIEHYIQFVKSMRK